MRRAAVMLGLPPNTNPGSTQEIKDEPVGPDVRITGPRGPYCDARRPCQIRQPTPIVVGWVLYERRRDAWGKLRRSTRREGADGAGFGPQGGDGDGWQLRHR